MLMRRNKGLLTLALVVSFFLYVNWFVSISNWSLSSAGVGTESGHNVEFNFIKNELRVLKSRVNERKKHTSGGGGVLFELVDAYESNEKALQINKFPKYDQFLLIVDSNQDQVHRVVEAAESTELPLDHQEIASLLRILHLNKAFLAEKNMFTEIKFKDVGLNVSEPLKAFNIDQTTYKVFSLTKLNDRKQRLVTFGIEFNNVEALNKHIVKSLPTKCEYIQSGSEYNEKRILASLYVSCSTLTIQIAIFYTRGSFLWISSDSYTPPAADTKLFGDKARAINK